MKALSQEARDILIQAIIEGERPIPYDKLAGVGELTQRGYIKGTALGVVATTKGVKRALSLKLVTQDGTDFLGKDGKRKARQASLKVVGAVIEGPPADMTKHQPAKSNAWQMGQEDAMMGVAAGGPFATEPEYLAGYAEGMAAKKAASVS